MDGARSGSDAPRVPVLVELFTSQGCLSCPPADELLILFDEQQPVPGALVVPLGEHVEYWNGQWHDPFSSALFTDRQQEYRRVLDARALYTPQMVIDGRTELIGSHRDRAYGAIASATAEPKATMSVTFTDTNIYGAISVGVTIVGISVLGAMDAADIWVAITEEGLTTDVQRGENAFRRLRNATVVRELQRVGRLPVPPPDRFSATARLHLRPEWNASRLRAVAFLQERGSRRVLGVAQARFD